MKILTKIKRLHLIIFLFFLLIVIIVTKKIYKKSKKVESKEFTVITSTSSTSYSTAVSTSTNENALKSETKKIIAISGELLKIYKIKYGRYHPQAREYLKKAKELYNLGRYEESNEYANKSYEIIKKQ